MTENRMIEPLISIVVPIYNVEKYLKSCVDSIFAQTYKNLEIILVDDGSPDNCGLICDEYASKDDRVTVIHQKNQGLSGARNSGIDISSGKYIMFVDSDDTIDENMVSEMYKYSIENECLLVACGRKYIFENGQSICNLKNSENKLFSFEEAIVEMNSYKLFDMSAWGKLYTRELFHELRFPVGKLSEDFFVMYKLIELAGNVGYIAKPFYNYLQRASSISKNKKVNEEFLEAAKEQMVYLDKKYPHLIPVGHVAYASAALTVYDIYIKNNVPCQKEKVNYFKNIVRDNLKYISMHPNILLEKKIQLRLFAINPCIYRYVFKLYKLVRRV